MSVKYFWIYEDMIRVFFSLLAEACTALFICQFLIIKIAVIYFNLNIKMLIMKV